MAERGISTAEVEAVLTSGQVIEKYPTATPFPAVLMLGGVGSRPLHVVAGIEPASKTAHVITVYEPDPAVWEPDLKTRRRKP
jgi:hypothetical protein